MHTYERFRTVDSMNQRPTDLFLVERYVPAGHLDDLAAAVDGVARSCEGRRDGHAAVEYLHAVYIPTEETCFCTFRSSSPDDVRALNEAHGFRIDRISPAVGFDTRPRVNARSTWTATR